MDVVSEINKALEFVKGKDYKSAENIYLTLLNLNPDNALILSFCGYLYLSWKKNIKAEKVFEKAYSISPQQSSLEGLALSKFLLLKFEEALPIYQKLISIDSKYEYYEKLTIILSEWLSFGKNKEYGDIAYKYSCDAVQKFPLKKVLLLNHSIICIYTGRFSDGEKYCYEALNIDSKYARAWEHLGFINEALYFNEKEAQNCYKKSIKYNIGVSGYYNLGISYSKCSDFSLATRNFNKALKIRPNDETVILGLAFNYLKQKQFNKGYKYYIQQNDSSGVRQLKNLWNGCSYKDKILFVYPDLAFGDHIQFIRYIPFVAQKFKRVKVFVYPQLYELFKNSFKEYSNIEFLLLSSEYPEYDYSVALSKLPYYLGIDFDNIPFSSGYLSANEKIIKSNNLKVGICWEAGNSDIRTTIHRTINIKEFTNLFAKDYDFYSFQVNSSFRDYKKITNLIDLSENFKNFNDTAGYLKTMDVVISVDTSVANLSGALGVKTFLLLPFYPDWRWFDNTEKTEWYSSIKIFKQSKKNSWEIEINKILSELTKLSLK